MLRRIVFLFPLLLYLAYPNAASADGDPGSLAVQGYSPKGFDQIVYKGLVGNVLDGVPMDPSQRVNLQRANAVLSNTLSGRSLAMLAGLSNPVLLIGGLIWGIWSASNIKPEADAAKALPYPGPGAGESAAPQDQVALLDRSPATPVMPAKLVPEMEPATPIADAETDQTSRVRSPVVKMWLAQRSSTAALEP